MRFKIVNTANLKATLFVARDLLARGPMIPGMALLIGRPGAGKTVAAGAAATATNAIFERCLPNWTSREMLAALGRHFGLKPAPRSEPMFRALVEKLRDEPRPIMVDEPELAHNFSTIEMYRAIHDATNAPVILIGTDALARQLNRHEQIGSRLLHRVEFRPPSLEEVRKLADELCEVRVADDAVEKLLATCNGSLRRIVVQLSALERAARRRGCARITAADWPAMNGQARGRMAA
jgi:DNA transposition AAA+ family ATPase